MGFLGDLFGGGSNAPEAASGYYSQIPGIYKKYLNPFMISGKKALGPYSEKLNELLSNPEGFIKNIMGSYHASPQYNNDVAAATSAANNASAAGGTLGTGAEQSQLASNIDNLSNKYQQQYLQNIMGAFMPGLQRMGGLVSMGANEANSMAQGLAQNMMDQGGLAYQKNEDEDNGLSGGISGLAAIASDFL
jgi:hypothetical protein